MDIDIRTLKGFRGEKSEFEEKKKEGGKCDLGDNGVFILFYDALC